MTRDPRGRASLVIWAGPLVVAVASPHAPADDAAARALDRARDAYRSAPIDERFVIEVRAQDASVDTSEGRLRLDLTPDAPIPVDLGLGPIRATSDGKRLVILHSADPERYVGVSLDALSFAQFDNALPSIALPSLWLALEPAGQGADVLTLSSLLPPIRLREVARTDDGITLSGRDGNSAVTLVLGLDSGLIQRFEATVPSPSGWYDLVLTISQTPAHHEATPPAMPELGDRTRVDRVSDLRPRGLVLVPQADLGWLPVLREIDQAKDTTPLASLLSDAGPMAIALIELADDAAWIEHARAASAILKSAAGERPTVILLFDPTGRFSTSWPKALQALADAGLTNAPIGWVDGRTIPLSRSLPRVDPAVLVVDRAGQIVVIAPATADPAGQDQAAASLRQALTAAP